MSDNLTPSQQAEVDKFATQLGTTKRKRPGITGVYDVLLWGLLATSFLILTIGLLITVWGVIPWDLFGKIALTTAIGAPTLMLAIAMLAVARDRRH